MSVQPEALLHCSFCGKPQRQVAKLVAGPGIYICNHCIDLCNDIIDDESIGGLEGLRRLSTRVDRLVERLREDGVPWDDIRDALRKEPGA